MGLVATATRVAGGFVSRDIGPKDGEANKLFGGRAAVDYDHGHATPRRSSTWGRRWTRGSWRVPGEGRRGRPGGGGYFLRGVWEGGDERGFVPEALEGGVEVGAGRP
jgi:hypothetical protein